MRMTYRQLQEIMDHMSEWQLDSDITIELTVSKPEGISEDFVIPAELRFTGRDHDAGLDLNHPIICEIEPKEVRHTQNSLSEYIESLFEEGVFTE